MDIGPEKTMITDEGVKLISNIKRLKHLTLMKHEGITKACLPYLNKLTDLGALNGLKKLKELYISSDDEDDRDTVLEKIIKAEETLPGCSIYTHYQ